MIHRIFSIFDDKAKAFLPPFILPNEGMAVRVFADMCNSESHQFGAHPSDYTLFDIGQFDDNLGAVMSETAHAVSNGLLLVVEPVSPLQAFAPESDQADFISSKDNGNG